MLAEAIGVCNQTDGLMAAMNDMGNRWSFGIVEGKKKQVCRCFVFVAPSCDSV